MAPLFALSIQPHEVTATPSGADDALTLRLVLGSFEIFDERLKWQ